MNCLDGMNLSEPQRIAVFDERSPLLVAAGAGSGKTRLLVAYFVRALVDERLAPEQLVAVTFTRKAAAELVSRIRSALEELGRPDLARELDGATVGTIHGLCRRLIRERALDAGVDPAANVLEAEAASLVKDRLSRDAWEQVVQQASEEQLGVLACASDKLRKQIVPLYDKLRGIGHERPQLTITSDVGGSAGHGSVETSLEPVTCELAGAIHAALVAAAECPRVTASLRKDLDRLERCLDWLQQPLSPSQRVAGIADTATHFPSRTTSSMEVHFQPIRLALTRYRLALAGLWLRPLVEAMNSLLAAFHDLYETHKLERGLLDFADLELRAQSLASAAVGEGRAILPPGSRLLIDEFQDTNALQYGVLSNLGASRVVMVGDDRQSIYRFRGADVGVFRARESELDTRGRGTQGRVHHLDANYRSRPEILAFLNTLFARDTFFGGRFAALKTPDRYGGVASASESAVSASQRPEGEAATQPDVAEHGSMSPAVQVVVVQRRQEPDQVAIAAPMQEAEANEVSTRVRRLIDDEGWSQRDIAILIPAQTHVDLYERALIAHGIDVYVVGGKGYYSQEEVADVVALLRLLVNPHDDLALVAALRSPLAGLSDDGLYLLGREGRKTRASLWEVVRGGGASLLPDDDGFRLSVFTERLLGLRGRVGRPGLARLIDEAVSACDYDLCLLGIDQGKRRFANVRKMMRMASEFESLEGPDIAGFVNLLESMDNLSDREGSAPTLSEGEDVVRIMTVHQAKGLEFPVVVLAGLGSDVHTSDAAEFMVSGDGRTGAFLRGSRRDSYEQHDLSWGPAVAILDDERAREREEDIRLLYVAMTRAEKRLILVGASPRNGNLDRCRIGRLLQALGFETVPEAGTDVPLEGLDVLISATIASPVAEPRSGFKVSGPLAVAPLSAAVADEGDSCPRFLQLGAGDRGPQRISFSVLAAYLQCPRRYYLERVLGLELQLDGRPAAAAVQDGVIEADDLVTLHPDGVLIDEDERLSGRDVGLAVHALLERLPDGDGRPPEHLMNELVREWQEETGCRLSEGELWRVIRLTLAFWESPFAAVRGKGATREAPFLFNQGDVVVSGVIDLLVPREDCWHIVDYKTNSLQGRSIEQVVTSYELQAVVYCLAALRCGAPAVRMDFVFLEQPDTPVGFEYTFAAAEALEKTLDNALDGLREGRFAPLAGEHCSSCSVEEVCVRMAPGSADGIQ
jgi:ATP-dependent helicase/nuclease subunit A